MAYYARRALGGAGVIVIEEASVHDSDWPYERAPLASGVRRPGWAAVAEACHGHGSLVFAALGHAGGQGTSHWSQRELWAPGPVPEVNTREVPKVMEDRDIEAVIDGFAAGRSDRAWPRVATAWRSTPASSPWPGSSSPVSPTPA